MNADKMMVAIIVFTTVFLGIWAMRTGRQVISEPTYIQIIPDEVPKIAPQDPPKKEGKKTAITMSGCDVFKLTAEGDPICLGYLNKSVECKVLKKLTDIHKCEYCLIQIANPSFQSNIWIIKASDVIWVSAEDN